MLSAPFNSRSKNIVIKTVVILELALRNVEREIFAADFVIATDDAALEDAPEPLNRVGMDCTDYMLTLAVIDNAVRVGMAELVIRIVGVGAKQTDLVRNDFADKILDCRLVRTHDNTSNDVTLALHRADHRSFKSVVAAPSRSAALIPMAVFVLSADICFVDFDNAAKLHFRFNQSGADLVAHAPSGFVRTEAHETHDLERGHSLFARQHQVSDFEPVSQRLVSVFEDGPGNAGEPITLRRTGPTLPVEWLVARGVIKVRIATTWANDALGPPTGHQIPLASCLVPKREHDLELSAGELVDGFRTFHGSLPTMDGYCHV